MDPGNMGPETKGKLIQSVGPVDIQLTLTEDSLPVIGFRFARPGLQQRLPTFPWPLA